GAYLSDDNRVLFDFCHREAAADLCTTPAVVTGKDKYYLPKDALDARTERAYILLPFEVDGKWGYCDRWMGEVVHEPQWGWCDHLIPSVCGQELARFDAAEDSIHHPEKIWEEKFDPNADQYDGRWGLLDREGRESLPLNFSTSAQSKTDVCWRRKTDIGV
ncbi:MAG: hypothetical protein IKC03_08885, partial [Oscillospiraceae bacterium]|nr:hypothetical protein [Oscillospiraceae bacterium]